MAFPLTLQSRISGTDCIVQTVVHNDINGYNSIFRLRVNLTLNIFYIKEGPGGGLAQNVGI